MGEVVILPKERDPRFITIRRGGTLTDSDHQLIALWAASCAEHVLDRFESERPEDLRPRQAIEAARTWTRGEIRVGAARAAAHAAAREADDGAARAAARSAGQAVGTAHMAAHARHAAAYAVKAVTFAAEPSDAAAAAAREHDWQVEHLPELLRGADLPLKTAAELAPATTRVRTDPRA